MVITIEGGYELKGCVKISGSKNAALPLICSSLLTKGIVTLKNIPRIDDIFNLLKIINILNVKTVFKNNTLKIDARKIKYHHLMTNDVSKLRGSSYLMSVMLALFGKCEMAFPGGCNLGARNLNYHFDAFIALGCEVDNNSFIRVHLKRNKPHDVCFNNKSVGATINAIILAGYLGRAVRIYHYANEPEVYEAISFLKKIGYRIYEMKDYLLLTRRRLKKKISYKNRYDRIEASSYLMLGAISKRLVIKNCPVHDMKEVLIRLKEINLKMKIKRNKIIAKKSFLKGTSIEASSYPGFPTDAQPLISALLTQAKGTSFIKDTIYPKRFNYALALKQMEADVSVSNNMLIINPKRLYGAVVKGYDLRGVFAIIIAACFATGKTTILDGEVVFRGYENLLTKLKDIGVHINN